MRLVMLLAIEFSYARRLRVGGDSKRKMLGTTQKVVDAGHQERFDPLTDDPPEKLLLVPAVKAQVSFGQIMASEEIANNFQQSHRTERL